MRAFRTVWSALALAVPALAVLAPTVLAPTVLALTSPAMAQDPQSATEWRLGQFEMPGAPVDGKPFALIQRPDSFIMLGCGRDGDPLSVIFGLRRKTAPQSLVRATSAEAAISVGPAGGAPIESAYTVSRREGIDGSQFLNFATSIAEVDVADRLRAAESLTVSWPGEDETLRFAATNSNAAISHLARFCGSTG